MSFTESYLSEIGNQTGNHMKTALYGLLLTRYFWETWNSEETQKLAAAVTNYIFCETTAEHEVKAFMADNLDLVESRCRELATEEPLCRALTCTIYNFSYGKYIDSGGKIGLFFHPFLGFVRAIQEVVGRREQHSFLDAFVQKVGDEGSAPLLRLLQLGLFRALPPTPDSKLMADVVRSFIEQTQELRTNPDALAIAELVGEFAAAVVVFSAKRFDEAARGDQVAFEDTIALLESGFEPRFGLGGTADVSPLEMSKDELFPDAFRTVTAFLCYYVHVIVNQTSPDPHNRYTNSLQSSVAKLCAGKFGFNPKPLEVFQNIQQMIPKLFAKLWINQETVGQDDALGKILTHITSLDGAARYAFLVGSERNPVGCAAHFIRTLVRTKELFSGAAEPTAMKAS